MLIRKNKFNSLNLKRNASVRPVLILAILFIITILSLAGFFFFKSRAIYLSILNSRQNLDQAIEFIVEGDFSQAVEASKRANDGFVFARELLEDLQNNFFIKNIGVFHDNISDFKNLAQSAEVLSRSAKDSLILIQDLEDIFSGRVAGSFSEFSLEDRARILKTFYESYPEMQGVKANIDLSLFYLEKSKDNALLSSHLESVDHLRGQLSYISSSLEQLISLSSIIPVIAGYPDPTSYLLVLQNSNELRPTGGFIGTYGILEIEWGDISKLETHDIYHLDMPASLDDSFNISPPEPLQKYLGTNRWFMRDANWSPDWPSSALNLQWFYEQEMIASNREDEIIDFSGVIAVNPQLVIDLLNITGPIQIDDHVYDKNNFIDILQYEVEMAFRDKETPEWERKEVIGDILEKLKRELFDLPSNRWPGLLDVLNKNILRKDILVYLNDDYSRQISSNLNWEGEIKNSFLDYLMLVDANLAALKTDRVMDKEVRYYLEEEDDNQFKARLEIDYRNDGWFDWQTTRYRSFTRLYVPYGSTLSSVHPLSDSSAISSLDEEISYPKTYFSSFISVEPQEEKTLVFEYYLPENFSSIIDEHNFYSLDLQKQAGNNISLFEAHFDFSRPIKKVEGEGVLEVNNNELYWSNELEKDYSLKVKF